MVVVRFGHWVCGESWHAIKGSLTHRPSSLGWVPGVLPLSVCVYVLCVCVCVCVCVYVCFVVCLVFLCWGGGFVCGGLVGGGGFWVLSLYLNLASMLYTCFSIHCCISVETPASF